MLKIKSKRGKALPRNKQVEWFLAPTSAFANFALAELNPGGNAAIITVDKGHDKREKRHVWLCQGLFEVTRLVEMVRSGHPEIKFEVFRRNPDISRIARKDFSINA